jgi:serine protease Do
MATVWAAAVLAALVAAPTAEARKAPPKQYFTEARQTKIHEERSLLSQVARASMSAVVSITTSQPADASDKSGEEQTGLGTGFIIHEDGYILTAAHVVEGATDQRRGLHRGVHGRDRRP